MKYKVGMYGGSFDPLHIGHIHDIIRAACECEELYVMISWCEGRESTSKELRYRWILNSTRHLSNVKIIMVEDKAVSKEEYNTDYYWVKGAQDIKDTIGKPIDAVYCGTDYLGSNRFESLYCPESEIVYFDRAEVPISSTDIRGWALEHWDYIPSVCKDYYCKKILIVGGESTGKSTLVQNLALAYNTNYVSEVGRETCEYAGGEDLMIIDDLVDNFIRQRDEVRKVAKLSNRLLFVDTDALTTGFYCDLLLEDPGEKYYTTMLSKSINYFNEWDLVLFLEPNGVDFVQDGTRNEDIKAERVKYSNMLKKWFNDNNVYYENISGSYLDRFNDAKNIIYSRFGLDTKF